MNQTQGLGVTLSDPPVTPVTTIQRLEPVDRRPVPLLLGLSDQKGASGFMPELFTALDQSNGRLEM